MSSGKDDIGKFGSLIYPASDRIQWIYTSILSKVLFCLSVLQ